MPLTHSIIIAVRKELGYTIPINGLCYGFSIRWLEAALLGPEEKRNFNLRLKYLLTESIKSRSPKTIVKKIHLARNKIKQGTPLDKKDLMLLDIECFFNSMELFHTPIAFTQLFDSAYVDLCDLQLLSYYASSDKIQALGGLTKVYSDLFVYDAKELSHYLKQLASLIDMYSRAPAQPVGIVLTNHTHVIPLSYQTRVGWSMYNLSQNRSSHKTAKQALAKKIIKGCHQVEEKSADTPYVALCLSLVLTQSDPRCQPLAAALARSQIKQKITSSILARRPLHIAYQAARQGDVSLIALCIEHLGPDLNKQLNSSNETVVYTASLFGHAQVVALLAECPELFLNSPKNKTPLLIAASYNHYEVIRVLLKQARTNVNCTDDKGQTPLFRATARGYTESVAVLLESPQIRPNQANHKGITPLLKATLLGHAAVIAEFVKHLQVNFNVTYQGITLAYIAAKQGDALTMEELIKRPETQLNSLYRGMTPAHIAAENGDVLIIAALLKRPDVDFNIPYQGPDRAHQGATPLYIAAQKGHTPVVALLSKHQSIALNQAVKRKSPLFIAAQNGHLEVIKELLAAGADPHIPLPSSYADLTLFAKTQTAKTTERIQAYLNNPPQKLIHLLPQDIAYIMGHDEIALLLQNQLEKAINPRLYRFFQEEEKQSTNIFCVNAEYWITQPA